MTPKEKAIEIVDSYFTIIDGQVEFKLIKQCALIAVTEILEATKTNWKTQRLMPNGYKKWEGVSYKKYWKEVKKEICSL
jgi:hypothetical protein